MMTTRTLLMLIAALGLLACNPDLGGGSAGGGDDDDDIDDDDDDDDDDDGAPDAVLLSVSPDLDEIDVPIWTEFELVFDVPPGPFDWRVAGSDGSDVDFEISVSTNETTYIGELVSALEPGATYRVSLSWGSNDLNYEFTTLPPADPDKMKAVIGAVYVAELLDGEFVQPEGAGPLIKGGLDPLPLMLSVHAETAFAVDAQPGFHMIGAVGRYNEGGVPEANPCAATIAMTAGPDQAYGTDDDNPGTFDAGLFAVGPTEMAVAAQGTTLDLREVVLEGTFVPSLDRITTMTLAGIADTRPLDEMLGGGGEGAICELLSDTVGVECFECGEPTLGAFCMNVEVEELEAVIAIGQQLTERTCVDVIGDWESSGICHPEALAYDEDGNGTYELCPAYAE